MGRVGAKCLWWAQCPSSKRMPYQALSAPFLFLSTIFLDVTVVTSWRWNTLRNWGLEAASFWNTHCSHWSLTVVWFLLLSWFVGAPGLAILSCALPGFLLVPWHHEASGWERKALCEARVQLCLLASITGPIIIDMVLVPVQCFCFWACCLTSSKSKQGHFEEHGGLAGRFPGHPMRRVQLQVWDSETNFQLGTALLWDWVYSPHWVWFSEAIRKTAVQIQISSVKVKLFQFRLQALRPYCLKARSNLLMASGKGLGLEDLKITYSFDSFPFLVAATCAS